MRVARFSTSPDRFGMDDDLEGQLFSSLGLVQPNPEFVERLKTRLTTQPAITVEHKSQMAAFLVVASGLFFGAFFIWIVFVIRSLLIKQTRALT